MPSVEICTVRLNLGEVGQAGFVASPYDKTLSIQVHKTGHAIIARSCLGPWTGGQEPRHYRTIERAPMFLRSALPALGWC